MSFLKEETWNGQVYSGGWVTPEGGDAAVIEPATGRELGRIGIAAPADVTRAVRTAAAAQPAWAAVPHTERAAILRRAAALWEANAAEIEDWVIRESGKVGGAAQFETHNSVQEIYEAATLPGLPDGELLPSEQPRLSFAERVPLASWGDRAVQLPADPVRPLGRPRARARQRGRAQARPAHRRLRRRRPRPDLRGGRTARRSAARAARRPRTGEAIITEPLVRIISFTGSTAVGRRIGELAARHLKRAHLELGGNSALVILDHVDVARAASAGAGDPSCTRARSA